MNQFINQNTLELFTFFILLLNPFLMSIYLLDFIKELDSKNFFQVLTRGAVVAGIVFIVFAISGNTLFKLVNVRFESFMIFGGLIFLIIGLRYFFEGENAITVMRGPAEHVAGSIALPFIIGPGTVSASIITGSKVATPVAISLILVTMVTMVFSVMLIKLIHDYVRKRNEAIIESYIQTAGRASALLIGMFAVEMIGSGIKGWIGG